MTSLEALVARSFGHEFLPFMKVKRGADVSWKLRVEVVCYQKW